jgi:glycosylphosphatidylinositol transamidase (GPIT) subunit GPI8
MFDPAKIKSHPGLRTDLFPYNLNETLVTDFFGGVSQVEVTEGEPVIRIANDPRGRGLEDNVFVELDVRTDDAVQVSGYAAPAPAISSHRMQPGSSSAAGSGWISLLALVVAGWLVWRVQRSKA